MCMLSVSCWYNESIVIACDIFECMHVLNSAIFVYIKVSVDLIPLLGQSDIERLGVTHVGERVMLISLAKAKQRMFSIVA